MTEQQDYDAAEGSRDGQVAADPSRGSPAQRRRALASALATELCDLDPGMWQRRASGSVSSHIAYVGDDVEVAGVIADAWDLVRSDPSPDLVRSQPGVAGRVVVAHGDSWTVVARSGGPFLVLSDRINGMLRIDLDPTDGIRAELTELVAELVNVSQGLPPYDESLIPEWPSLPWPRHK